MNRFRRSYFPAALLVCGLLGLSIQASLSVHKDALAAPLMQFTPFPTPTPGPDGRIIYIAQENDTWWRIAAIFGMGVNGVNELKNLNEALSDVVIEGQEILLGFGGPSEVNPTLGPSPTPTSSLPTPTPQPGSGTLCVILYNDANGDSMRQEEEPSIPGGAISVTDRSGENPLTETTAGGLDPICFAELPQDDYNISVAVPDGYNPTTVLNYALAIEPGAETHLDFGAQPSSAAQPEAAGSTGSNRSLMLGMAGGLLLLGGVGLGIYAGLMSRAKGRAEQG